VASGDKRVSQPVVSCIRALFCRLVRGRGENTNAASFTLTKNALLRNLDIADKLGCLDDAGLAEMRRGKAPSVRKGPYNGDQLSVDHIISTSSCAGTGQRDRESGVDAAAGQ
jgi:hypothetical protein